jgi:NTP pyrophosphatase (non-canonical NTP hydrolase)
MEKTYQVNEIDFSEYQILTGETAIYPSAYEGNAEALSYVTLGLTGEAGEIANKVKKIIRDNGGESTEEIRADLAKEIGDVLWYLTRLADEIGYSLEGIAVNNAKKLQSRKERGVLGGSGDNR